MLTEYEIEVVYRPGPRNANADYSSSPARNNNLVLIMELEPDFKSVAEYLSRGNIDRASSSIVRAARMRAKNYRMHESDLHRRTLKGLRFVPG